MRFLLLTQYFPPEIGAAQTRLGILAKELVKLGHEVEVVTAFPNYPEGKIREGYRGFYQSETIDGVFVHRFWLFAAQGAGFARLLNYLSFTLTCLAGLFRVRGADYVFVNSGPLFLAWPGWIYSKFLGAKMILNVSDLWPRSVEHLEGVGARIGLWLAHALEEWAYETADFVNAVTVGIRETLIREKNVPEEKILFLPNGIDLDASKPEPRSADLMRRLDLDGKFVLVYPGNHGLAHALHRVLECAKEIEAAAPQARFLLVGGGSDKGRLIDLARGMGLKNVLFEGPVPPSELGRYIDLADVGLVHLRDTPLAEETRPAKLFPLMAHAKPVIYCGRGEGARIIESGGAGWVLPPERPDLLKAKILELLSAKEQISQRGKASRDFAEKNFSAHTIISNWLRSLLS